MSKVGSVLPAIRALGDLLTVSASLVRAGTSRIIVADQRTMPAGLSLQDVAYQLLGNGELENGLGGAHYQLNKVAIWTPTSPGLIEFSFFGLDAERRNLVMGAACGHAAAAVGMVALLDDPASLSPESIRVLNRDTGQLFEFLFRDRDRARPWNAPCTLRLLNGAPIELAVHQRIRAGTAGGRDISWAIIHQGNSFALIDDLHACDRPEVRRAIQQNTLEIARAAVPGHAGMESVRAVPYAVTWSGPWQAHVRASCFNGEQRHKSLPVSGAIALCDFLALGRARELAIHASPAAGTPRFTFIVETPSSSERADVQLRLHDGAWHIDWSSYNAHVRLLFMCTAVLDG